jgi:hypothetical protein
MRDKRPKQGDEPEDGFLTTTARAVGSTLGKLAAKTGLAHAEEPPAPLRKKKAGSVKRTVTAKRVVKKVAVKKKVSSKKTAAPTTKR